MSIIVLLWILKTNFRNVLESILDKSGLSIFHGQWENLCAKTKLISVIAPFHSVAFIIFVKILFRNISNPPPPPWQKWIHVTIICFEYIFWFFDHETKTYEMPHCVPPWPPFDVLQHYIQVNNFQKISFVHHFIKVFERNGILLPKLFWPTTVRKKCSSDWVFWDH